MTTRARSCSMRFAIGRTPNSKVQNDRLAAFPHDDRTVARAVANAVQAKLYFSSVSSRARHAKCGRNEIKRYPPISIDSATVPISFAASISPGCHPSRSLS